MAKPQESNLLRVSNRREWRAWLRKHYKSEKEIWLVYPKRHTGRPRIPYNDAVEEALSFGWIDSTVRTVDEGSFAQRFSPRNPKSAYSQANLERLRDLVRKHQVAKDVLAALGDLGPSRFKIAPDVLQAIRANASAHRNFKALSPAYVRIRIAFIEGARNRPREFQKRLAYFIKMTEKNKTFGFGGIEKYY